MTSYRKNKPQGGFFALKHVGLFAGMALLILVVDIILYFAIALFEANISYYSNTDPVSAESEGRIHVSNIADSLSQDETGSWIFNDNEIEQALLTKNAWAILVNKNGNVEWNFNTPADFPNSFSQNEIAVLAHDRAYAGYVTFIWTKDSDLVIMGYPDSQYLFFGITLSSQAFLRIPLYFLLVFTIDLLIVFLLYAFSQRSLLKNTGPMLNALDNLAQGKPAHVHFNGTLRVVGNRINAVSDTLLRKETARKNWVAGVSHDVRTPLAIVMGHAERIENDTTASKNTQESASIITRQGIRIRNLIEDLNIATQLEYDMQPLKIDSIPLAKLLRSVVADYLNQSIDNQVQIDLKIAKDAACLSIKGDERLLKRALRNAIDNSLKHNPDRCRITISLNVSGGNFILCVADDGRGMNEQQLLALAKMLERDYLGIGSLTSCTKTSITFSKTQLSTPSERKPGSPDLPPYNTSQTYKTETPLISSQKNIAETTLEAPPVPPANKRPPQPPIIYTDKELTNSPIAQIATSRLNETYYSSEHPRPFCPPVSSISAPIPHGGSIGKHGLGLPLIARIVLVHDGTLTISSTEGSGFSIIATFPLSEELQRSNKT